MTNPFAFGAEFSRRLAVLAEMIEAAASETCEIVALSIFVIAQAVQTTKL